MLVSQLLSGILRIVCLYATIFPTDILLSVTGTGTYGASSTSTFFPFFGVFGVCALFPYFDCELSYCLTSVLPMNPSNYGSPALPINSYIVAPPSGDAIINFATCMPPSFVELYSNGLNTMLKSVPPGGITSLSGTT